MGSKLSVFWMYLDINCYYGIIYLYCFLLWSSTVLFTYDEYYYMCTTMWYGVLMKMFPLWNTSDVFTEWILVVYELEARFWDIGTKLGANATNVFLKALYLRVLKMHDSSLDRVALSENPTFYMTTLDMYVLQTNTKTQKLSFPIKISIFLPPK